MNPRILKEVRPLLPVLGLILAAMTVTTYVWKGEGFGIAQDFVLIWYVLGCLLLGSASFGHEFQHRTMTLLLSQPISRRSLWSTKIIAGGFAGILLLLGASVCSFFLDRALLGSIAMEFVLIWCAIGCLLLSGISLGGEFQPPRKTSRLWNGKMITGGYVGVLLFLAVMAGRLFLNTHLYFGESSFVAFLFALVFICSFFTVPFWILVSKSAVGGAVFSFVGQALVLILLDIPATHFLGPWNSTRHPVVRLMLFSTVIVIYTAVLYWLGYKKFLKLQLTGAQEQELKLPAVVENAFGRFSLGSCGVLGRLISKELGLQRVTFILAVLFCAIVALEKVTNPSNPSKEGVYLTGTIMIYFTMIPIILGAIAVAEERSWGVAEWHLTLPVPAFEQWMVKVLVTLLLTVVLGVILPLIALVVAPGHYFLQAILTDIQSNPFKVSMILSVPCFVVCITLYAASISITVMKAIMLALGILIASIVLFIRASILLDKWFPYTHFGLIWHEPGTLAAILFICAITILWLAFLNYRDTDLRLRRIWPQWIVLCTLIVLIITVIFSALFSGDTEIRHVIRKPGNPHLPAWVRRPR